MASNFQVSVTVNNTRLDAMETACGASAVLKIWTGTQPANCAAADSGTLLANISLPADWMGAAASNLKSKSGTWQDASADNNGTAGHYRIYASDGTTCHFQGTCGTSGADMNLNVAALVAGLPFTVDTYTWAEGNT